MRWGLGQRPWLSVCRSSTRPSFSATRWEGRLCRPMMAISRSTFEEVAGVVAAGGRGLGGQAPTLGPGVVLFARACCSAVPNRPFRSGPSLRPRRGKCRRATCQPPTVGR